MFNNIGFVLATQFFILFLGISFIIFILARNPVSLLVVAVFLFVCVNLFILGFLSGEGRVVNTPAPYAQQLKKGVIYHVIVRYTDGKHDNILNLTSGKYHGASHKIIVIRVKKAVHFKNFMLNPKGIPVQVPINK